MDIGYKLFPEYHELGAYEVVENKLWKCVYVL
jgi:hypothetical protein